MILFYWGALSVILLDGVGERPPLQKCHHTVIVKRERRFLHVKSADKGNHFVIGFIRLFLSAGENFVGK